MKRNKSIVAVILICLFAISANGCSSRHPPASMEFFSAAERDDLATLKRLVGQGQSVNQRTKGGETPLFYAVDEGLYDECSYLISQGADVNATTVDGVTPIEIAARRGDERSVRILLESGADPSRCNQWGQNPIFALAKHEGSGEAMHLLIEKGANPRARDNNGDTPLFFAAMSGCPLNVKFLIELGCSVNERNNANKTPLITTLDTMVDLSELAAKRDLSGQISAIRTLLEAGAELDAKQGDADKARDVIGRIQDREIRGEASSLLKIAVQ